MNDYRILVVDDEEDLCEILKFNLETEGYEVSTACSAEEALTLNVGEFDLLLLDVMMGGMSGFALARLLKANPKTASVPIIFLTARDTENDTVTGFNLGADDYLGKPFDLDEVAARLRALVRRRHGVTSHQLGHGPVSFDPQTRTVSLNGQPVTLGQKEVMLVELLLLNRQSVLSRSAIEEKLYPWGEEVSSNSVEVLVHRIRRKLGSGFIKTVHSVGYTLGDAS